ncbi:glycosyltransferase family 8 protein [Erwinia pyrifoliae]|uniref:Glycosyltransferase family 8 protein n=1 Tax=Erwinia pyrifoliae TaxID=79967 RepID=A0ABY5XD22_ERWPY|nr:glycosyltransferase family 8 protein [Erwinia pyrifoliae]AUX73024.1 glycosyltransferase family 8 protein [Erwinia pyrifoliae]MCA8876698.1 glycosyltransferase family 8 protein [Erwinia pyrifoliae]MCT2386856.1 glycosyltransferase family 8 protein [Erwinia pyrifoliae]MCU8587545.1 glycosyltransferase family 8 protein [Erwinia pyrifoliae]UWS31391.1 glycosyltransferase family 8 protein [Erwinia pyrifoliae]
MKAWVTLLTQPDYLPGVRTLHASLQASQSRYPLVVMITGNIDATARQRLEQQGCILRDVAPIRPNPQLSERYAHARFSEVWTKLAVWALTEFEQVAFLDADMLVMQNMDELFSHPLADGTIAACHACRCNPGKLASYPASWIAENCFYSWCTGVDHVEQADKVDNYLNSGFLLLKPDNEVFDNMLIALAAMDDLTEYRFPEQDFLNQFYRARWRPLPWIYNALKTLPHQHPAVWQLARVKNIHFILDKPWQKPRDKTDRDFALNKLWWDVAQQLPGED